MVLSHLRHLELPHIDKKRWQKLKELYAELDGVQNAKDLTVVLEKLYNVAGNNNERVSPDRSVEILNSDGFGSSWCFEGLKIFLEEIATREEKEAFFISVLPFVVSLASSVDEFAPSESILLCSQQRDSGVVLERRFIACILASAFLCALPPPAADSQVRSINFVGFFGCFHREEIKQTQAAKLRCFLHYFERLKNDWPDVRGRVFYSRQVIPSASLPKFEDWESCDLPLCPVIIDSKASIEDSGEHMLQVDFANRLIGGGVLGGGHVQEEIRFCINPELLVARMFMEALQDNECIVIRGVERFSSYSGYGKTFEFKGDFKDQSQLDEDGNFQTTIVAIDATQFKTKPRGVQYEESALVRELNKALVGFYNPEVGSEIIRSPSDVECEDSSSESEVHVVSSEEAGDSVDGTSSPAQEAGEFQAFSANLVRLAITQAFNEVDSNNNSVSEDFEDGADVLTFVMKKSLNGVFGSKPNKARRYSENLLPPTPIPKCLTRTISGSNTPVVPGTPPSSPAVFNLERTSPDSLGFQTSLTASQFFSMKSFADPLYNSLLSCVELTSSLASDIATTADSPIRAAAGSKESFQKSPRNIISPVKNGEKLISFLSQKVCQSKSPPNAKHSNGFHFKDFVDDLTSIVRTTKKERYYDKLDSSVQFPYCKQNLLKEFTDSQETEKAERPAIMINGLDCSNAKRLDSYASELSRSIVGSSISSSVFLGTENLTNESKGTALDNEELRTESVTPDDSDYHDDDYQTAVGCGMETRGNGIIEGHVHGFVAEVISVALTEAAVLCGETGNEEDSGKRDKSSQNEDGGNNESENQIKGESEESSSESTEEERSDRNEAIASINTPSQLSHEITDHLVNRLVESVLSDSLAKASKMIKRKSMEVISKNDLNCQEETHLEIDDSAADESSFSDEEVAEDEAMQSFAESFSGLTVRGAVEIAKSCIESPNAEPRVRPIATGNWGCGVFRGDPELKALIQWVAASAAGCPVIVYHTFGDRRLLRLLRTLTCLLSRGWRISDVIQGILRFRNSARNGKDDSMGHQRLLSFLCHTPQTSL